LPVPIDRERPVSVVRRSLAAERETAGEEPESVVEPPPEQAEPSAAPAERTVEEMPDVSVARARPQTYTVQRGDTLIGIARRFYGAGGERHYRLIFEANADRVDDPRALAPGQELIIPPLAGEEAPGGVREMTLDELRRHFNAGATINGPETYTVERGDNLTKIARRFYGRSDRDAVMKIYRANRDVLQTPNVLPVGTTLKIPR
jgi:nucleoid-associated protein YgaU